MDEFDYNKELNRLRELGVFEEDDYDDEFDCTLQLIKLDDDELARLPFDTEEELQEYIDLWDWMPKDFNPFMSEEGVDEEPESDRLRDEIERLEEIILRFKTKYIKPLKDEQKEIWKRVDKRARKKFWDMFKKGEL